MNATVGLSTTDEDFAELTADEDREILGYEIAVDAALRVVLGFSTSEIGQQLTGFPIGGGSINASRSTLVGVFDDEGQTEYTLPEPVEWAAGEGLHVGVDNLSADDTKLCWVVIFYREV